MSGQLYTIPDAFLMVIWYNGYIPTLTRFKGFYGITVICNPLSNALFVLKTTWDI